MQLLRASSKQGGTELDLGVITAGSGAGNGGIPHGEILMEFAEAIIAGDDGALSRAREAIIERLGAAALVDAAAVAGLFNAIDRVADSTGTPLEAAKAAASADVRQAIGINEFRRRRSELDGAG